MMISGETGMRFYLRLTILACFLVLGISLMMGWLSARRASGEGFEDTRSDPAETALKVLTENCGQCHRSSLPTANAKALAIFDLDKKPWYPSVTDQHLESMAKRLSSKKDISDSDRTATVEFINSIRRQTKN
jgi:hypothetical protein